MPFKMKQRVMQKVHTKEKKFQEKERDRGAYVRYAPEEKHKAHTLSEEDRFNLKKSRSGVIKSKFELGKRGLRSSAGYFKHGTLHINNDNFFSLKEQRKQQKAAPEKLPKLKPAGKSFKRKGGGGSRGGRGGSRGGRGGRRRGGRK
jgi:hypothetical protein